MLKRIANWLVKRARKRAPDYVIGGHDNPYLLRWWLLPRNPLFNVYIHQILRPDDDRALHDHPWFWCSYLVEGAYIEVTERPQRPESTQIRATGQWQTICEEGSLRVRSPWFAHRLVPLTSEVWTVFVVGPTLRVWGFHCPKGWRPWRLFVDARDKGRVGRGCE